jgi:hypothetical protein
MLLRLLLSWLLAAVASLLHPPAGAAGLLVLLALLAAVAAELVPRCSPLRCICSYAANLLRCHHRVDCHLSPPNALPRPLPTAAQPSVSSLTSLLIKLLKSYSLVLKLTQDPDSATCFPSSVRPAVGLGQPSMACAVQRVRAHNLLTKESLVKDDRPDQMSRPGRGVIY